MTLTPVEIRDGDLPSIVEALRTQRAMSKDVVIPASLMRMDDDGTIVFPVDFTDNPILTEDGVDGGIRDVRCTVGRTAGQNLAARCGIHSSYWNKLDAPHTALRAQNVNYWTERDSSSVLARMITDGTEGYLRAVLSDRFGIYDSLDAIVAVLEGVQAAGIAPSDLRTSGDLTDARMRMRFTVPGITVDAADLVARYRNPHTFLRGPEQPLVAAGWELANSEVGAGAFTLTPRIVFLVCTNGATRTADRVRRVHFGARMDEGTLVYSAATQRKALDLLTSMTKDAIEKFCTVEYVQSLVDELRGAALVEVHEPATVIGQVLKAVHINEDRTNAVLDMFARGGDTSVLGIGQAITAQAQREPDMEVAAEMEAAFFDSIAAGLRIVRQ